MKTPFLGIVCLAALAFAPGCASDGTLTPRGQQAITTGLGIAEIALAGYSGYTAATTGGAKATPATYTDLAQNAVYGMATLAQANVGKTPAAANLAAGAGNTVVGSAVQAALPQTPLTQTTVQTLFDAAAKVPKVADRSSAPSAQRRLRTLYYGDRIIKGTILGGAQIVYRDIQ